MRKSGRVFALGQPMPESRWNVYTHRGVFIAGEVESRVICCFARAPCKESVSTSAFCSRRGVLPAVRIINDNRNERSRYAGITTFGSPEMWVASDVAGSVGPLSPALFFVFGFGQHMYWDFEAIENARGILRNDSTNLFTR